MSGPWGRGRRGGEKGRGLIGDRFGAVLEEFEVRDALENAFATI